MTEVEMRTLLLTVGLPRSGKSSWAKATSHPIVNPDAMRLAVHDTAFIKDSERIVWTMVHYMVKALFIAGHETVILDATNTTRKRRDDWKSDLWVRKYRIFDTSAEECVRRCAVGNSNRPDLIPIIARMAENYEPVAEDEWDANDADISEGQ
jgi:predicted kinase